MIMIMIIYSFIFLTLAFSTSTCTFAHLLWWAWPLADNTIRIRIRIRIRVVHQIIASSSRLRFRRKYHKVHQGDLLSPKPLKHYFQAFWSNNVNQWVVKYKNCIPELVSANRAKSGKRFQSKAILRLVQRYLTKIIETFSPYKQCKKRTEK